MTAGQTSRGERLRQLSRDGTDAPWEAWTQRDTAPWYSVVELRGALAPGMSIGLHAMNHGPDSRLIAEARNALDDLLDVLTEARKHACPLDGLPSPHIESSDEGTAYCRMCELLARFDTGASRGGEA